MCEVGCGWLTFCVLGWFSLGLSPFLMEKLVARLREEEVKEKQKA